MKTFLGLALLMSLSVACSNEAEPVRQPIQSAPVSCQPSVQPHLASASPTDQNSTTAAVNN